jgi:lipoprotein NlpD
VLPASRVAPLRAGLIIEGETPLPGHHRRVYVVRRGETLASIARRHHVGVEELAQLNGLAPYARLKAGNRLVVEVSERKVRHRKKKTTHTAGSDAPVPAGPRAG